MFVISILVVVIAIIILLSITVSSFEKFLSAYDYKDTEKPPLLLFSTPDVSYLNYNIELVNQTDTSFRRINALETFRLKNIFKEILDRYVNATNAANATNSVMIESVEYTDTGINEREFLVYTTVLFTKSSYGAPIVFKIRLDNAKWFLIGKEYVPMTDKIKKLLVENLTVIAVKSNEYTDFDIRGTPGHVDNTWYVENPLGLFPPFKK